MDKVQKYLPLVAVLNGFTILLCLMLILTDTATPTIRCFAVDEADRIYVGTEKEICVYADGTLVNTINPKTSRSFMFTIVDKKIILSTATKLYTLDLEGNVLDVQEDAGADMYNQIQYKKQKFISPKGDVYRLIGEYGRTCIIKNNSEKVYQISLLSFAVKITITLCSIILFAIPIYIGAKGRFSYLLRNRPNRP